MSDQTKPRIRQLYSFLREANLIRFRPVRSFTDHPKAIRLSELPQHESIQVRRPIHDDTGPATDEALLRITRPRETRCPSPPESVRPWLLTGWDDPTRPAEVAESLNITEPARAGESDEQTITIRFEDDAQRTADHAAWIARREAWAAPERAAFLAAKVFQAFYEMYARLEKEVESLELIVANGRLSWQTESSQNGRVTIDHPVLFKRVELRFDPNVPEFTVLETEREPELYDALFLDLTQVEPAAVSSRKRDLETHGYHPFGQGHTEAFLRAFIQTVSPLAGEFLDRPGDAPNETPQMWLDPMVLLRKRVLGLANTVEAILEDIDSREIFPPALGQITGTAEIQAGLTLGDSSSATAMHGRGAHRLADEDILLAKEANQEQIQIIRRLESSNTVIVQGPPGTGKTHTIGNLIGHLLAQGKSILVTAHTTKALRVLREKVPAQLRDLCVSVLGSDQAARRQLESSVGAITERLTRDSATTLAQTAQLVDDQRRKLIASLRTKTSKLKDALANEYREIVVGGRSYSPSDAARFVAANAENHSWIPSPVIVGADLTLNEAEITRLYVLNATFSSEEESDARGPLPTLSKLPAESEFEVMVTEHRTLLTHDLSFGAERWAAVGRPSAELETLAQKLAAEFSSALQQEAWRAHAIVAGLRGGATRSVWENLITAIERAAEAHASHTLLVWHQPQLSSTMPPQKQIEVLEQIKRHLGQGGSLNMLVLLWNREWSHVVNSASVAAGRPQQAEHFEALRRRAELEVSRLALRELWNELIGSRSQKSFDSLPEPAELSCHALIPEIRRCLDWHATVWKPLATRLEKAGLRLDELFAVQRREASPIAEYLLIERLATQVLPNMLAAEAARRRRSECEVWFKNLTDLMGQVDPSDPDRGCAGYLLAATLSHDPQDYVAALDYARRLHALRPLVKERDDLLARLRASAPAWAEQIAQRILPHDGSAAPHEIRQAWTWRQIHDELAARDALDAHALQRDIDKTRETLRQLTQDLIDAKAWGKQLERLQGNSAMRQALVGWLDTTKRLASTRQLEKRQSLLAEGRKLMRRCSEAVPVWIMPIQILAESFDLRTSRFDVIIVDEASQADLNALIPLYMGKQVVVVGDHEQVTPLGVGQDQTLLENLRKTMLVDIPNAHLFDNLSSIYDIGRQSFGDAVRLVEHFRCVPEIIAFSNQLSYDGKIQPLREATSTHLRPACVARRVEGKREGQVNEAEAESIVATIKAMLLHPAYAGKTIGVISMLGEAQATLIERMLLSEIDSREREDRRIQASISGGFQGDERDVIFLSLVESAPDDTSVLRRTGDGAFEQTKKRYNVAASRARDQLWVVHSFDPKLNLRPGDLRYELLRHVEDPQATLRAFDNEGNKVESPFEREVLKRLCAAGYKVKSQWQVGYFRIDLVVEGGGKRLAVECDGDRWHPVEKLSEDLERQTILERLGWEFVRIRGTAFYRNPDAALQPLFARLAELEIPKDALAAEEASTTGSGPAAELTLVQELDALIGQAMEPREDNGADAVPEEPVVSLEHGPPPNERQEPEQEPREVQSDSVALGADAFDLVQIEELLKLAGGVVLRDDFLRLLARHRGFQRLGKHIRLSMELELEQLARRGRVVLEGEIVRLKPARG